MQGALQPVLVLCCTRGCWQREEQKLPSSLPGRCTLLAPPSVCKAQEAMTALGTLPGGLCWSLSYQGIPG